MNERPPRLSVLARRLLSAVRDIGNALQEQNKATAEANEAANAKQSVTPLVRAEVDLPHGVETRKSTSDARSDNKYQFFTLLILWLTFGAVVVYATLAYLQWREMIGATDATERAVHEARLSRRQSQREFELAQKSSNDFATGTLNEMKKQSKAMKDAASANSKLAATAQEALEAQTRPWLGIDGAPQSVSGSVGNNPTSVSVSFTLKLRNYGPSPAIFNRPNQFYEPFQVFKTTGPRARHPFFEEQNTCNVAPGNVLADSFHRRITIIYPGKDGAITQRFDASLDPKTLPYMPAPEPYVIGCIAYQSPQGKTYHLRVMYQGLTNGDKNTSLELIDSISD
jgi:hypothetical protein